MTPSNPPLNYQCVAKVVYLLANNDSYAALKLSDDLLMTGATGTNVADLQLFVIG